MALIIGIRGLTRGDGHWGPFPEALRNFDPSTEFQTLEIPGNGTQYQATVPLNPETVVHEMRVQLQRLRPELSPERSPDPATRSSLSESPTTQVVLLGMSLGGMIALKWAELFPDEISQVLVVNTSLSQFSSFYQRLRPSAYPKILQALLRQDAEGREAAVLTIASNRPEQIAKFINPMAQFSAKHPVRWQSFVRQLVLATRIRFAKPPAIRITVLVALHDRLVSAQCSQRLAKAWSLPLETHPTAGHDLPLDAPEWLAEKVCRALKK